MRGAVESSRYTKGESYKVSVKSVADGNFQGELNSVISSFNRNFTGYIVLSSSSFYADLCSRHDGNPGTHSFVTSPELATVFAYHGALDCDPTTDSIRQADGSLFKFTPPKSDELPASFSTGEHLYQAPLPVDQAQDIEVRIDPSSDRLQKLEPFEAWREGNALDLPILMKVRGKCTTDHISPAGPWYDYRGHLDNISNNMLTGAENAFLPDHPRGMAQHCTTGEIDAVPVIARSYKESGTRYCIIGHNNYGEGSSREHAALEPRYLGAVAIIANGFARIHETNLKKQGMLPLTFADPTAWERIRATDRVSVLNVEVIKPGEQLTMVVSSRDGSSWKTRLNHSLHEGQIPWLLKGSALNHVKSLKR